MTKEHYNMRLINIGNYKRWMELSMDKISNCLNEIQEERRRIQTYKEEIAKMEKENARYEAMMEVNNGKKSN